MWTIGFPQLTNYVLGCEEWLAHGLGPDLSASEEFVARVQCSQQVAGIDKNHDCFDEP